MKFDVLDYDVFADIVVGVCIEDYLVEIEEKAGDATLDEVVTVFSEIYPFEFGKHEVIPVGFVLESNYDCVVDVDELDTTVSLVLLEDKIPEQYRQGILNCAETCDVLFRVIELFEDEISGFFKAL